MLVSSFEAPEGAFAAAESYAAFGMNASGYAGEYFISKVALRSYVTEGDEESDLYPRAWIPHAFVFWVMKRKELVARVAVRESVGSFRAERMEFVAKKGGLLEAIGIADRLADEPGDREIRFVEIPQFNALLLWVTGPKPRFVDRVRGDQFTEETIVEELVRRRRIALGIEPGPDDTPRFER